MSNVTVIIQTITTQEAKAHDVTCKDRDGDDCCSGFNYENDDLRNPYTWYNRNI